MTVTRQWTEKKQVEDRLIEQLRTFGYSHATGAELAAERETQREVVLKGRLTRAIRRFNPWISEDNLNKVLRSVTHIEAAGLIDRKSVV